MRYFGIFLHGAFYGSRKKNSESISRVLYCEAASIINLESRVTTCFSRFLPSNSREQRSNIGILGIAAHSIVVSPAQRRLVSVPVTKHCCLTAVNRCGALCCPDFPRDRGLKQVFFFPYPAIDRYTIFVRFAHVVCALLRLFRFARLPPLFNGVPENFQFLGRGAIAVALNRIAISLRQAHCDERAAYGNRTRLLGLGSRCTTDVLMPQIRCKGTT